MAMAARRRQRKAARKHTLGELHGDDGTTAVECGGARPAGKHLEGPRESTGAATGNARLRHAQLGPEGPKSDSVSVVYRYCTGDYIDIL
jgi:hypothetical protein